MEHRWSRRVSMDRNAMIECARHGALFARTHDLSLHGVRVVTGEVCLAVHTPLIVEFSLAFAQRLLRFRVAAMVVRKTADGAALMFLDLERATQQALRAALYESVASAPELEQRAA
jgi:hypothetical protein